MVKILLTTSLLTQTQKHGGFVMVLNFFSLNFFFLIMPLQGQDDD
jgi:hypothetical protein